MENRIENAVAGRWAEVAEAERQLAASPSQEAVDRLAASLLAVADTCRSVTRDGDPEIAGPAQFAECAAVAERLSEVEPADPDLARRARALIGQVRRGQAFHWYDPVRTAALCALGVIVAFGGAALGGDTEDVTMVVVSAILGSGLIFATILTARRPMWRVHAEQVAPMIRRHGL